MAIDVYHQVLLKLYEETGGRPGKTIDFAKLLKELGLYGNYESIFERANREGWIAESTKQNYVEITTWGILEVKKLKNGDSVGGESEKQLVRNIRRATVLASELAALLEDAEQRPESDFDKITVKFNELQNELAQIKK